MSISPEIITVIVAGIFAFAGGALAQFTSRKLTAAQAENFLAQAEKMRAEAEALRWQSEKAATERESDKKALADALTEIAILQREGAAASALDKKMFVEFLREAATLNVEDQIIVRNLAKLAVEVVAKERDQKGDIHNATGNEPKDEGPKG